MPDDKPLHFRPRDGTTVGAGLALLNDLLRATAGQAPSRRVVVMLNPKYGPNLVELYDLDGRPLTPKNLSVVGGRGAGGDLAAVIARNLRGKK